MHAASESHLLSRKQKKILFCEKHMVIFLCLKVCGRAPDVACKPHTAELCALTALMHALPWPCVALEHLTVHKPSSYLLGIAFLTVLMLMQAEQP